ncbi:hypothetical protein LCGC14_1454310 [marine sediment metagenome]|uniref:Uncharacterized protein n=1 Tax=marine sediment metagenome TaxID=412755 RepID=A0A0F9LXG3_9ZZZZ
MKPEPLKDKIEIIGMGDKYFKERDVASASGKSS